MEQNKLPNATAVLILGIASLLGCCCYGILGLILGIVALVLAKKDMQLYKLSPENYSNYSTLNTGRILAIIGLIISILYIIMILIAISVFGIEALQDPDKMNEIMREYGLQ